MMKLMSVLLTLVLAFSGPLTGETAITGDGMTEDSIQARDQGEADETTQAGEAATENDALAEIREAGMETSFLIVDGTLVEYTGNEEKVTVPEGVTALGDEAFQHTSVTAVYLPDTLKTIGNYCFFGCERLREIRIPASVTRIGHQVFAENNQLKEIQVDEGNEYYTSVDGVLFTKDGATLFAYPAGKNAGMPYEVPEGTLEIRTAAFSGVHISSVSLPASLTLFDENEFANNPTLREVLIDEGNVHYQSVDGMICRENTLLLYPNGKDASSLGPDDFPENLRWIGNWAFQGDANLKEVEFPEGIESIGWMCFTFAESIERITVPASVERIDGYAFADCGCLKEVIVHSMDAVFPADREMNIFADSPRAVLYGYENSTAQAYAAANGIKFVSLGEAP